MSRHQEYLLDVGLQIHVVDSSWENKHGVSVILWLYLEVTGVLNWSPFSVLKSVQQALLTFVCGVAQMSGDTFRSSRKSAGVRFSSFTNPSLTSPSPTKKG